MKKDVNVFLRHILQSIGAIERYTKDLPKLKKDVKKLLEK